MRHRMTSVSGRHAMRLSIVVVTFNSEREIRGNLEPLAEGARLAGWEIVVVDNASSDGTVSIVGAHWPRVRVIQHSDNLGYSAAVNSGLRHTQGEYVLLVNADVAINRASVAGLVGYMETHPGAAIVGPRVVGPDGGWSPSVFRWVTVGSLAREKLMLYRVFRGVPWLEGYTLHEFKPEWSGTVPSVSGCAMLMRRVAVEQIGPWDERFFLYGEDNDFCRRAYSAGWDVHYCGEFSAKHIGGASAEQDIRRKLLNSYASAVLYARKHSGRWGASVIAGILVIELLGKIAVRLLGAASRERRAENNRRVPIYLECAKGVIARAVALDAETARSRPA